MPTRFPFQPRNAILLAALAAVFPLSAQATGAARVDFATGDVSVLAPDGRSRPLARGAEIHNGELVDTGSGRAQLRFSDGAQVSLAPQTQFRVDDYRFEGKADGSEKGLFSLLKGGLRTITGIIGRNNRDNYRLTTTVATIGIRGTEYSVTYGKSISVTTGEGSIEVCNAAGCLILNNGETGYVADSNTQPVMTDMKTEIPPPPPAADIPLLLAGNETGSDGRPAGLPGSMMPSGSGYLLVGAGFFYDGGEGWQPELGSFDGATVATVATFDAEGLASFSGFDGGEGTTFTREISAGMLTDGILGWGRWTAGVENYDGTIYDWKDLHYVVGIPTAAGDMSNIDGFEGSYALSGYTHPTHSGGLLAPGTLTGSLTANFHSGSVDGSIQYSGTDSFNFTWTGTISGSSFSSDCSLACSGDIAGFFAGTNASRAGLVYQYQHDGLGSINGAAVFTQTGLVPY